MKQKKIHCCNLLALILTLSLLNGCVAGTNGAIDSSNNKVTTLRCETFKFQN